MRRAFKPTTSVPEQSTLPRQPPSPPCHLSTPPWRISEPIQSGLRLMTTSRSPLSSSVAPEPRPLWATAVMVSSELLRGCSRVGYGCHDHFTVSSELLRGVSQSRSSLGYGCHDHFTVSSELLRGVMQSPSTLGYPLQHPLAVVLPTCRNFLRTGRLFPPIVRKDESPEFSAQKSRAAHFMGTSIFWLP